MKFFSGIQAMRGVAAMLVVVGHATGLAYYQGLRFDFTAGAIVVIFQSGVDIFFVISGFIIATTVSHRLDRGRGRFATVAEFLVRRAIRLYPVYWIVLAAAVAVNFLVPMQLAPNPQFSATLTPANFLLTARFNYLIPQAWTLFYEVWFYGAVAILLLVAPRRLFAGVTLLAAGLAAAWVGGNLPAYPPQSLLFGEFFLGVAVAYLVSRDLSRFVLPAALLAVVPFAVGAYLIDGRPALTDGERLMTFGLGAALLIYAVVAAEQRGMTFPRFLRWLGDISYSAYIWHWLVLIVLKETVVRFLPPLFQVALWVGVVLAVAALSYTYLERPALRLGRTAMALFDPPGRARLASNG